MHILCPHCHNPIELVKIDPRAEISCPSCGSSFHLEGGSTTGWEPQTGQKLGKFELIAAVGQGGCGTVYKARDPELDRIVAVKVPRAGNLAGPQELDRFLREARSVARLRHPSIVPVHEVGQQDGVPYLVSDFVQGVTLADLLSARRPGFRESAELIAVIADALQYAHEHGVIHRDVKPSNVMIGEGGAAFVMDFGLAKRDAGEITMTVEGQVLGTPAYMPPEQARGEGHAVDARGDVYSLGVMLYQLLTGELPFRGTQRMLLHQVLHDEPRPPHSLNDHIPRDLETIAMKAMAKEPGRRYATAWDFADDLRHWLKGEPIQARPVGLWERGWRWAKRRPAVAGLLAVSGVAALALVGLGVGLLYQQQLMGEKAKTELALQAEEVAHREAESARQTAETARAAEEEQRKKAETAHQDSRRLLYVNKLVLAEREWTAGNIGRVKQLLQECPEEARGWEWRYLDQLGRRELARLQGPNGSTGPATISPDWKWVVSGNDDYTLRFWVTTSGEVTHQLTDKTCMPDRWLELSPDAKLLVSVGWLPGTPNFAAKLWDAATGVELQELKRFRAPSRGIEPGVQAVATFSPDGQWLALASVESGKPATVTLWDVKTRPLKLVHTLTGFTQYPVHMAFSPKSERLAYLGWSPRSTPTNTWVAELKIWQIGTQLPLIDNVDLPVAPNGQVVFSPDGKQLAFAAHDRAVHVWDAQTGKERAVFRGDGESPEQVAYSSDGKLLAFCGNDGIVHLWDPVSRKRVRTLRGDTGVLKLAFSADGRRLMTINYLTRVAFWDPHTGQDPLIFQVNSRPYRVAVSPDGRRLACGTEDGAVTVWVAVTGRRLLTLRDNTYKAMGVAFNPNGSLLASAAHDRNVKLWDPTTGQLRGTLTHEDPLYGIAFSPDGHLLATCSNPLSPRQGEGGKVNLWSVASGKLVRTFPAHTNWYWDVAFSPDGQRLVSASEDRTARIWDVRTGAELVCFRGHDQGVSQAKFSPDGRRIASASADKTVKVWDTATGKLIRTLEGHTSITSSVAFSHDGRRIASSSADGIVKIWDAASGEELYSLHGHEGMIGSTVFGPEDQWLVSVGCDDRTVRVWEATPLSPERRLQRAAATLVNEVPRHLGFKAEILAYLRDLPSLSEDVRKHAIAMAERLQEDPWRLNRASYDIMRQPGLDAAKYRLALRQAEAALRLAAPEFRFYPFYHPTTQIGITQYRLGQFREAVENLKRSEAYHASQPAVNKDGMPWNLSFLAMAHHQLGDMDKAQTVFDRLHEILKNPVWSSNRDAQAFLREAEALIEGKAQDPKK